MGGVQRKRGNTSKNKKFHRLTKTKHYQRDHDQIHADLLNPEKRTEEVKDEEKPGAGESYCISCARHFADDQAMRTHLQTKRHKRRLRVMKEQPYRPE